MGGGSKTTVTTNVPPPSETELELQKQQLAIAKSQLEAINQQSAFQQKQFDAAGPLLEGQSKLLQQLLAQQGDLDPELAKKRSALELADLEFALKNAPAQQELLDRQLDTIRRGGRASPEELETINLATEYALDEGGSDIDAFTTDALQQLREQLAPALGLRSTDSPILDRGGDIAREGVRQKGQLSRSLRGAQQTANLNFPLAQQQFASGVGQGQQSFLEGVKNFQAMLRDSALNARLQLAGGLGAPGELAGRLGLGLATGLPGAGQAIGQMQAQRFASASQTTSQKGGGLGIGTIFGGIGAAGGLFSGLGAIGAAGGFGKVFS